MDQFYRNPSQQSLQQQQLASMQPSERKYYNNQNYLNPNQPQQQQVKQSGYGGFQQQQQHQQSQLDMSHMTQNPHNQSYYQTGYTCEQHPGEPIVNMDLQCLKELCPECITQHYRQHQVEGTVPEIETIKTVKNNCSKKLKAAIVSLSGEMEKTEMQYLTNPEVIIEEGIQKIERCKEKVIQQVLGYFDQLEQNFKKNVHENMLKAHDFQPVFDKIRSMIQELEVLNNQLDTGSNIGVIKKICLLDLKSLMEKFSKDIHKVIDNKDLDPIQIQIDDSRNYTIQQELQRLAKMVQNAQQPAYQNEQMDALNRQFQQQTTFGNVQRPGQSQQQSRGGNDPTPIKINANSMAAQQQLNNFEQNLQTNPAPIPVQLHNYFESSCKMPNVHFFLQDDSSSKFFIWHILETNNVEFQSVNLAENQFIPTFHKSITVPNGDIYLIGGRNMDGNKSNEIYKFDLNLKKLSLIAHLIHPRSSHGIEYMNGKIYIVGGYTSTPDKKSQMTGSVEEFDIKTGQVREVQSLNHPSVSISLTSFNDKYLFKFGGMAENRQMSLYIEKYDRDFDTWTVIDPKIPLQKFSILSTGCCAQINERQIMVFGGYTQDSVSSRQSFIFEVDEKIDGNCQIHSINYKPLPYQEGFWNNNAFVHNNNLYAIQNVASENMVDCIQNERKILRYNGNQWETLNP